MLKRTDFSEKRQFGRRPANLKAWIRVAGRPPVPCTLSNTSAGGALIHLESDVWIPYSFRLTSEDKSIDRIVEVRHQHPRRIGVEYVMHASGEVVAGPVQRRGDEVTEWSGHQQRR